MEVQKAGLYLVILSLLIMDMLWKACTRAMPIF